MMFDVPIMARKNPVTAMENSTTASKKFRHCERSAAVQSPNSQPWIAALCSQRRYGGYGRYGRATLAMMAFKRASESRQPPR